MRVSPYSNRGERIEVHISVYEEREIIEYICVINKEKRVEKSCYDPMPVTF